MSTIALRGYQERAVERMLAALPRSPLLASPTGSGKTVIVCELIRRFGKRVVFCAHRRELIYQGVERLAEHGIEAGIIMSGEPRRDLAVQVASVQTLARRDLPATDLVIFDEAHHATAESYKRLATLPHCGVTATPFRLSGEALGDVFGEIVVAARTQELVDANFLVMPRVFAPHVPSMQNVKRRNGEFETATTSAIMSKPALVGDVIQHWKRHAHGKRTLAFCVDVKHSMLMRDAFVMAGVRAEHVDGKTPHEERKRLLAQLRDHEIDVLFNVGIAGEGYDLPALEAVVILQPTASLGKHLQIFGRIMRPWGEKQAVVLDHAGNTLRHGPANQELVYSLEGKVARAANAGLGLKRCLGCYALVPTHLENCPHCGMIFESRREIATKDGELVEFQTVGDRQNRWRELVAIRHKAGRDPLWALRRYHVEHGSWPDPFSETFTEMSDPSPKLKKAAWDAVFAWAAERISGDFLGWCEHRFKDCFGVWPKGVKEPEQIRARA